MLLPRSSALIYEQFMAWERSFEARVLQIRERELKYQRLNYIIEVSEIHFASIRVLIWPYSRLCSIVFGMTRTIQ